MTTKEILDSFTQEDGIRLFNNAKSDREVYDLFVEKGLTDSYETFISEVKKIGEEKLSQLSKEEIMAQIEGAELSDEQLEAVAGGCGKDKDNKGLYGCLGAMGVVAAAGAAF